MADNITLNAGSGGATLATDEVGAPGPHYQIIKLADGTLGGTQLVAATSANGLDVDVTRMAALVAGSANIGDVDVLTLPPIPAGTNNIGDVDILTIAAGDNNIGNVDVVSLPALVAGSANIGDVDIASIAAGDTNIGNVDIVTMPTVSVQGEIAHDTADSGNPIKLGAEAIAHGANPTTVAAGDRTQLYANQAGVPFVIGGHPNIISRGVLVVAADGAQADISLLAALVAADERVIVTRVTVLADKANSVDVGVQIGFGTANVPTATTTGVSGMVVDHRGIPAGGGVTVGDGSGIIAVGGLGEELRYDCEAPTGGALTIQVSYYVIDETP